MAGPKLRAQAIARTIAHIERVEAGKTGLIRVLNQRVGYSYTTADYIAEEKARLAKLRGQWA
jgi:hypothetical protein